MHIAAAGKRNPEHSHSNKTDAGATVTNNAHSTDYNRLSLSLTTSPVMMQKTSPVRLDISQL
jgi:hypothetical protein